MSAQTGKKYRLPTEAEWEYAAKGGVKCGNYIFSGSNDINEVAWNKENSAKITHAVGQKKPNELGIFDMTGNVAEMCSDWYDAHYYSKGIGKNPTGPKDCNTYQCPYVLRGSSFAAPPDISYLSKRNNCEKATSSNIIGFRLVKDK